MLGFVLSDLYYLNLEHNEHYLAGTGAIDPIKGLVCERFKRTTVISKERDREGVIGAETGYVNPVEKNNQLHLLKK